MPPKGRTGQAWEALRYYAFGSLFNSYEGRMFLVEFLLGVVLFYAPFAVGTRLFLQLIDKPHLGDAHSICLRMPIQWLRREDSGSPVGRGGPTYGLVHAMLTTFIRVPY